MAKAEVGGETLLYSYLEKELQTEDIFLFQMVTARLVTSLGVWFHPSYYAALPIVLPHVVRDTTARKANGGVEAWSSPNSMGYVRDDNTLIKNLVKTLEIASPRPSLAGKRLGKGWVASHLWRSRADGTSASRHHQTNSFVPNLVWLPKAIALLSDRADSSVQQYLQAVSYKLYGHIELASGLQGIADEAWAALPKPTIPESGLPDLETLNFFAPNEAWIERKRAAIARLRVGLDARGQRADSREI